MFVVVKNLCVTCFVGLCYVFVMGEIIDLESMHVIVNNSHEPMSSSNYYMDYHDQYCFNWIFWIVVLEIVMHFH